VTPRTNGFWRGDYRTEGQNPEKLSCVQVPVNIFYVAREIIMAEQRR
jgi:hypothetical protein